MTRLEDLQPRALVHGVLPDRAVIVVGVQWYGSEALELTYKDPTGRVGNVLLYRHDEPRLEIVEQGRPWSFDGDGALFRLVSEAHRIRLARLVDPVLAVHTSLVEPLPHQITAVYASMLPRQPLRFLLADDQGAGKTIMAGLLIRELLARGDLPPVVMGGFVVPMGLLAKVAGRPVPEGLHAGDTQTVTSRARAIVMEMERPLGFEPWDREADRLGYDIESRDPRRGRLRFIEVKGRVAGADTVTVTKTEILRSLNKPDAYILAIVECMDGDHHRAHCVRRPFRREPDFGVTNVNYDFAELLARAEEPR